MNTNCFHQLPICQASLHRDTIPLHNLTGIWADVVHAKNLFFTRFLFYNNFGKSVRVVSRLGKRPLEGQKFPVVNLDPVRSVLFNGIFFGKADARIFQWCEHGGANVDVIHGFLRTAKQAARQSHTGLDRNRRELWATIHDIPDGINIGTGRLFKLCRNFAILRVGVHVYGFEAQLGSVGSSTNSRQYGVIDVIGSIGKGDLDFIVVNLFEFRWCHL
mmetsp:Transcript_9676/g.20027  ORF Transcript_9676/g.20027 Transcript_9676/m.20027 type:complete len:217 (-) Transcript_9676:1363-2013(-)